MAAERINSLSESQHFLPVFMRPLGTLKNEVTTLLWELCPCVMFHVSIWPLQEWSCQRMW